MPGPHAALDQLLAAEHAAAVADERGQQLQFLRRDLDGLARAAQLGAVEIHLAIAEPVETGRLRQSVRRSMRPDAGAQFAQAEGLGHVVVGARVEAEDLLRFLGARRQQDDRRPGRRPGAARGRRRSRPSSAASRRAG